MSACYVWDFTYFLEDSVWETEVEAIRDVLKDEEVFKKWGCQVERGKETGKLHVQGRFSLVEKKRENQVIEMMDGCHISRTSKACSQGEKFYEYVTKDSTRVAGPWRDSDMSIPESLRDDLDFTWWQEYLMEIMDKPCDRRKIYCIVNPNGNIGKSTWLVWMAVRNRLQIIPPLNSFSKLMEFCCSMFKNKKIPKTVAIDMPRAMNKSQLNEFYSAIEMIKSGYIYDSRYCAKELIFDPPHVFVFTNLYPDRDMLSNDRWKIITVENNEEKTISSKTLPSGASEEEEEA